MNSPATKPVKSSVKERLEIIQSIFTILAIVAGGWWFIEQRSEKPQVKVEHFLSQRPLAGAEHKWLMCVDVRATNVGKTKVRLEDGETKLTQINPIPGVDLKDEQLKGLILEPGESDQALFKTYVIPDRIRTIEVHSNYTVPTSMLFGLWPHQKLYWNFRSLIDIGESENNNAKAK